MAEGLGEDFVKTAILVRLPVRTLLRFRCLSKTYCAEIDSEHFIKSHIARSNIEKLHLGILLSAKENPNVVYSVSDRTIFYQHANPFLDLLRRAVDNFIVVGSCRGVVCITDSYSRVSLLNAETRKHLVLPDCLTGPNCSLGFGYDSFGDDYKVIKIRGMTGGFYGGFTVAFYSLRAGEWTAPISVPDFSPKNDMGIFIGHKIYWLASKLVPVFLLTRICVISYDISTHMFDQIRPPNFVGEPVEVFLGSIGDNLAINFIYGENHRKIWVRKGYMDEEWIESVELNEEVQRNFMMVRNCCFSHDKPEEEILIGVQKGTHLLWYNLESNETRISQLVDTPFDRICKFANYFGSLVRLPRRSGRSYKNKEKGEGKGEGGCELLTKW